MKKSMLAKLIDKWESERGSYIPNGPIYDLFISEAKTFLEKEDKSKRKKEKKTLTISTDNANAKANALLKDYSLKYCKKIAKTSIMLSIADGDNKGEEYWEDVLIEIKKWSN
jgi:hypothetical protein